MSCHWRVLAVAVVLWLPQFRGVFVGGTYIGNYERPASFGDAGAHSVNVGASFSVSPRCGFDVLPLVVGPNQHATAPAYAGAVFWRCMLWTP